MKKSLTRILSLVLVLVMMLGVMPLASAATGPKGNSVSLPADMEMLLSEVPSGGIALTPTITPAAAQQDVPNSGYRADSYSWQLSGGAGASLSSATGSSTTLNVTAAGTYTITLNVVFENGRREQETVSDSLVIEVKADPVKVTGVGFKSDTYQIKVGKKVNLTPDVFPENATDVTLNYSVAEGASDIVSITKTGKSDADINGLKPGTVTIKAEAADGSGKFDTCVVTVEAPDMNGIAVNGNNTVKVGKELTLTAKALPVGAELNSAATYDWDVTIGTGSVSLKAASTTSSLTIVGEKAGTVSVTVSDGKYTSQAFNITVEEPDEEYTVAMNPDTLSLKLGETSSSALAVVVKDSDNETVTTGVTTANWKSSDNTIATVESDHKVKASSSKNGSVNITCDVLVDGTKVGTATCAVTVGYGTVTVADIEVASDASNTAQLAPTFSGGTGYDTSKVNFKYTAVPGGVRGVISVGEKTGAVSATGPSSMVVKVEAFDKATGDGYTAKVGEANAVVSFYARTVVEATMLEGATEMLLGKSADIKESGTLLGMMLADVSSLLVDTDDIAFSGLAASEGKLSGNNIQAGVATVTGASAVKFTVGTDGKAIFSYEIIPGNISSGVLCKGTVELDYDGELADIEYSTTYNKPVTFDEADFYKFWASANKTGKLSHVKFAIGTTYPGIGALYTKAGTTSSSYAATSTQKFYYGAVPTGTLNKDLGALTYVPQSTKLNTYDVSVPFTAYTADEKESVSGTVVIHLNEKTNSITPRGIFFGTEYDSVNDKTYADQMAEIFYNKTNKVLDSVIFTLPAAEKATLYSKVPTSAAGNTLVAQATRLGAGDRLTVKAGTTLGIANSQIKNVALIPAAGFKGQLTISFTGYASGDTTGTPCTITFDVKTKTASQVFSDVTAKNYSWASDSVDFLYYEGTAQGSNGKYNPAAKITRRDFMLMLYRAFLAADYGTFNPTTNFPDVVKGTDAYSKEIYQAVGVAKYLGIAQGTNDRFNPTANITRQEAMVLIYRTLDVINKDLRTESGVKLTSMKDYAKISSWATAAISNLVGHGVIQGNNDNIKPLDSITRAEMAAILHRVITY